MLPPVLLGSDKGMRNSLDKRRSCGSVFSMGRPSSPVSLVAALLLVIPHASTTKPPVIRPQLEHPGVRWLVEQPHSHPDALIEKPALRRLRGEQAPPDLALDLADDLNSWGDAVSLDLRPAGE